MAAGADRGRQSRADELLTRIKAELSKQGWSVDLSLKDGFLRLGSVQVRFDLFEHDFDDAM
jgi:hypothetical protein